MDGNNNSFAQANQNNGLNLNPAEEAGLTPEQIETPQTAQEYYLDSLSAILRANIGQPVSYTHLRAHETRHDLVCRLLLEKKNVFCLKKKKRKKKKRKKTVSKSISK